FSRHNIIRLLANRPRDLAPVSLDSLLRFLALEIGQCACYDEREPGKFTGLFTLYLILEIEPLLAQALHQFAIPLLGEEAANTLGDFRPHLFGLLQLFFARRCDFIEISECFRQELPGPLADKWNTQSIQYTWQSLSARSIDIRQQLLR